MPPKTIRRGDDRPSTDSPHCQHPSSPFQIPSFNTASAAGYSGINMGTGAVGTAVGGALTDLPPVPVPTSAASGTLSALSWLMAFWGPIWWVRNAKKIWEIWGFFAQMLMFPKKMPKMSMHQFIFLHQLVVKDGIEISTDGNLMGKIGGDWTAHDLG